ncbi:MAG: type II toxin-antitoxin system RelE/ParE family toxin [Symploca sp. SIO2G7]|nr:type II toxin-antitoxin system RelE/ParE family toxin [Symploca sp. SIO2G7]
MPCTIKWSTRSLRDIKRLTDFLQEKNPQAAQQAAKKIQQGVLTISSQPNIGVALPDQSGRREYFLPFGKGNYVIRYRQKDNLIAILRVFHSREYRQ